MRKLILTIATVIAAPMVTAAVPAVASFHDTAAPSCVARPAESDATAAATVKVWLAGDSTMADPKSSCPVGWGSRFDALFNDQVTVVNKAVSGRSIQTWLYESNVTGTKNSAGECVVNPNTYAQRWLDMLDPTKGMRSGDYLFIQFGINDSSPTCDRHVGLAAFKASYGMMAQAAKERGSQPIFVTPVSALACQGNTARGTRGEFVTATEEAGEEYGVPVIDLHARSVELYNALGLCPIAGGSDVSASTTGKAGDFFCEDHTHFERAGAQQIAELIVEALRDQSIHLAAYLK